MRARVAALTAATFHDCADARAALRQLERGILETQIRVARVPAPTGDEERRARWVARRLEASGLRVARDAAGNVIGAIDAVGSRAAARDRLNTRPVVVCAHLDTVFPAHTRLTMRREGPRIVGPGICDNGRGLAVMLAMARVMARRGNDSARAIEFVATTGEEGAGNLRGAKHYFATHPAPFAVIALDGAGDERIVNSALGSRRFRATYRGPGGHTWAAFGAPNAVHAAARAAAALATLRLGGESARSALSVSRIGGGMSINAIPEEAWLEVDARSTSESVLDRLDRDIRAIIEAAAREENQRRAAGTPALTYGIERIGDRPGGVTPPDHALVVAACEATRLVGRAPELAAASTDANAAMAAGAPAIAIGGGGRGGDAHSSHEWFDDTNGSTGVERALVIAATMARLAAD